MNEKPKGTRPRRFGLLFWLIVLAGALFCVAAPLRVAYWQDSLQAAMISATVLSTGVVLTVVLVMVFLPWLCARGGRRWVVWSLSCIAALTVMFLSRELSASINPFLNEPWFVPISVMEMLFRAIIHATGLVLAAIPLILFVRWLCCWRNFRRFGLVLACLGAVILVFYAEEDWRGWRAWKKFRSEWEAKGEKFDLVSLAPKPVPDDQNLAMTPLFKSLSYHHRPASTRTESDEPDDGNPPIRIRADLMPWPDTNSPWSDTNHLVLGNLMRGTVANLEACRSFYRGNTNYPQPTVPGSAAADILVALGKFDAELKELREAAVARPYSRFPLEYDQQAPWFGIQGPHLSYVESLTMLTEVRTVAMLEAGRTRDAFEELKLGFRLSDSIRDEPLLADYHRRINFLTVCLQGVREGLIRHAWSDVQLVELEHKLAPINLLVEFKNAVRGDLAFEVGWMDWMRRQRFKLDLRDPYDGAQPSPIEIQAITWVPGGWLYQNMVTLSRYYQECVLAAVDAPARRIQPKIILRGEKVSYEKLLRPYEVIARMFLGGMSHSAMRSASGQTCVDAARIACALERYRWATGQFPATLEALAPRFINQIPNDIMDGRPLRYRLAPDDVYIIYSVGWNGTDDGGTIGLSVWGYPGDITKGDWIWFSSPR